MLIRSIDNLFYDTNNVTTRSVIDPNRDIYVTLLQPKYGVSFSIDGKRVAWFIEHTGAMSRDITCVYVDNTTRDFGCNEREVTQVELCECHEERTFTFWDITEQCCEQREFKAVDGNGTIVGDGETCFEIKPEFMVRLIREDCFNEVVRYITCDLNGRLMLTSEGHGCFPISPFEGFKLYKVFR